MREKSVSEESVLLKAEYHFYPFFDLMVQSRDEVDKQELEKLQSADSK